MLASASAQSSIIFKISALGKDLNTRGSWRVKHGTKMWLGLFDNGT
jgi:hypothetical protein